MDPPAKAHWADGCEAQGAVLQLPPPVTTWSATTPPPSKVNEVAVSPAGSPWDGSTAAVPRAGTDTDRCTVGTVPEAEAWPIEVMVPLTRPDDELVRKMVAAAAVPVPAPLKGTRPTSFPQPASSSAEQSDTRIDRFSMIHERTHPPPACPGGSPCRAGLHDRGPS